MYNGPTFTNDWSPNGNSFIEIFLHCFPCYFIEVVMVKATNNALLAVNAVQTTFGELMRYIGMMLLMSCYMKLPDYFWRTAVRKGDCSEDEENDMPSFTFNLYMLCRRYAAITSALRFTIKPPPSFRDKFWQIRDLISAWNEHMQTILFVPGEAINREFENLDLKVGDSLAITGKLDGEEYFLWALKEPSYIMKMMATGGPLLANESCKEQKRRWIEGGVDTAGTFQFPCPYDWHYKFRHAVNDHNNLRHALPSIEHTIITNRWEMRVFSFVLAVTEVNAFLAYRFFCRPDPVPILQQFRHKLAWELIKNKWLAKEDLDESHVVSMVHQLMVAPNNATKYANGRWLCNTKQPNQNYPCSFKQCGKPPKRIKTYCSCCPTKWICKFCHAADVVSELKRE